MARSHSQPVRLDAAGQHAVPRVAQRGRLLVLRDPYAGRHLQQDRVVQQYRTYPSTSLNWFWAVASACFVYAPRRFGRAAAGLYEVIELAKSLLVIFFKTHFWV
jgi:hypothetical protein